MSATATRAVIHTDAKPTGRQIYALAHKLAEIAGLEWPATRAAASELLEHVTEQHAAICGATGDDNIPF